jgi:hypothetical protein
MPTLVAFYKGHGKDVFRFFLFRYDDDRQFLFHDLRRNKRLKIALGASEILRDREEGARDCGLREQS